MDAWLRAETPLPAGFTRWTDALAEGLAPGPHTAGPDDLALLPYTSGTTGLPKGCMHTHRTLMHNAVGGAVGLRRRRRRPVVARRGADVPHHRHALQRARVASMRAASVVLMPRWDRELAGRLISRYRITHWTCIPTMVIDLFGSPNYRSFDLSSLRSISGGGAAMPQAVAQRLQDEFGLTFAEGYGLTETAAPTHANPPERAKLQCLGIPIFGVDSRVVDPVTLRGAAARRGRRDHHPRADGLQGLLEPPGGHGRGVRRVRRAQRFFRTGDLGRMDEEGYFFMTDRLKRMINASGFKVWPAEVEMLLYRHPAVQEACIIAAPRRLPRRDRQGGRRAARRRPRARPRPRTSSAGRARTWRPTRCRRSSQFVDALPKSGSGKVMWRLLQDQEAAG